MIPERIVVADLAALASRAAEWIAGAIGHAVQREGRCTMALAGGNTPRKVYQQLAALPGIPWASVSVYFGDERALPPDAPGSNYGMARAALLSRVAVPAERIHRMEAERAEREQAARDYERLLPDSLDVLLLGMGADGHTASLFPGASALDERDRRVVPSSGGIPAVPRLTITPPVIRGARALLMMVAGAEKAEAVAAALEGSGDAAQLPARLARHGTWILDRAAAGRLTGA